ncbi:unnamed protein product [Enterobius vermicularis]|uniref:Uncharacterized protein n=1 Tax=Enterobius vermicularis TaxID=51028 RepID=A0A0N4V2J5_ENTVE|nr:unnamed protein product [Enterobius vermicularis]
MGINIKSSLFIAPCHFAEALLQRNLCIVSESKIDLLKVEDPVFVREFDRPRILPYAHSLVSIGEREVEKGPSVLAKKGLVDKAGAFDDFDHFDFEKAFSNEDDSKEDEDKKTTPN